MKRRFARRRTIAGRLATAAFAVALVSANVGAGAAARATTSRALGDGRIPPPVAQGSLRVAGALRDGGTVRGAGLSWSPPHLPSVDRLLTFEVAYTWEACADHGGGCVVAADTTVTPFASRTYIVGHLDSGTHLRLTETATEVVETDPATFSFTVVHASAHATTRSTVAAYPSGRPPRTEFVNGMPERRTASNRESFQVDPPHANAADGAVVQRYRVDDGPWKPVPDTEIFSTGQLGIGPHRVTVNTSNAAGAGATSFSWQVVPMPPPEPCRATPPRTCWYPPHLDRTNHPMRWDWQIGRVTPLERTGASAVDIYDIDGFLTTPAEVHRIHTTWQANTLPHPKAVCYLDLAWEDYRPDGSPTPYGPYFPARTLGKIYYGYPQERWVDLRQLDALKPLIDERIGMCASKGFDAIEFDDIDSFNPPSTTGFHLTAGDVQNFLAYADNQAHREGMAVLWKNSELLSWWGRDYTDGAVVEECYVYQECFASQLRGSTHYGLTCTRLSGPTPCGWDDFTTDVTRNQPTGKWVGEAEYAQDGFVCNPHQQCRHRRRFSAYCRIVDAPPYGFAAVKFDVDLNGAMFHPCPKGF